MKKLSRPSIVKAMNDSRLFGSLPAEFRDASWDSWKLVLRACYGEPLSQGEVEWFCQHTGRTRYDPPPGGWSEVVLIVGRQCGKSQITGLVAAYEGAYPLTTKLKNSLALIVAQDQRTAQQAVFSYATEVFEESPAFKQSIVKDPTTDRLKIKNGVTLGAYPCKPNAVRGPHYVVAICDEFAFFRNSEGYATDLEMLRAIRPALVRHEGKLWILSSPYARKGELYNLYRKHYGNDGSKVLVIKAPSLDMNPTLSQDRLKQMEEEDPVAYRNEMLGEFRDDVSSLFRIEALQDSTARGVYERAPQSGVTYHGFVDAAGGAGNDSFATAIAHFHNGVAQLDAVLLREPEFDPFDAISESAALLKRYGLAQVTSDRYAGGFVPSGYDKCGIRVVPSERSKSQIYLDITGPINARGRMSLLDNPVLIGQFLNLDRTPGREGRDHIDHPPGGHDDMCNAAAGALLLAYENGYRPQSGGIAVALPRNSFVPWANQRGRWDPTDWNPGARLRDRRYE